MKSINHLITRNIENNLPEGISIAKYLQEKLILGKEAAYRRIRDQVPYTFDEIIAIAGDLHFSLDNVLEQAEHEQSSETVRFKISVDLTKPFSTLFVEMFQRASELLQEFFEGKNSTIWCALNRIPFQWFLFPNLLRFEYCRYLLGRGELPFNTRFSDVQVPPEAIEWQKKSAYYFYRLPHILCVVDSNTLQKTINGIKYSYLRQFLSKQDVQCLQEELTTFLETIVQQAFVGKNEFGTTFDLYYSPLPIDSNCLYFAHNDIEMAQFYIYYESPIVIMNNPTIAQLQKRWIESRIRYSTLISRSNNLFSSNLYKQMHQIVKSLGEIDQAPQNTLF